MGRLTLVRCNVLKDLKEDTEKSGFRLLIPVTDKCQTFFGIFVEVLPSAPTSEQ
ncbi:hypothetical protein Syun_029063 [Stephania yunnanensis]|uniref:Uncharacterized protein n=1 Tax=Stephania yunnanensis TaxID=152371 RepID=A0AAP0HH00_9MAGN